jgi:DNA-directed RNA polymerase specialized sigma24 family protein
LDYSQLAPDKLFVICADRRDDAAWREFVRRFHPLISGVVVRVCHHWGESSHHTADDIVQEIYLKLCTNNLAVLRAFSPIGPSSVYGFVKVFAANHAHDILKAAKAKKRGGSFRTESIDDPLSGTVLGSHHEGPKELERKLLFGQVLKCLERVVEGPNAVRDKRVFWLYYRLGLSASAIAGLPTINLSTKGVESTILRLTKAVRDQLCVKPTKSAEKTTAATESSRGLLGGSNVE